MGRSLTTRWISVQKGLQQRLLIPAEVSPLHMPNRPTSYLKTLPPTFLRGAIVPIRSDQIEVTRSML